MYGKRSYMCLMSYNLKKSNSLGIKSQQQIESKETRVDSSTNKAV